MSDVGGGWWGGHFCLLTSAFFLGILRCRETAKEEVRRKEETAEVVGGIDV